MRNVRLEAFNGWRICCWSHLNSPVAHSKPRRTRCLSSMPRESSGLPTAKDSRSSAHPQDEIIGLSIEHLMPERFRTRHLRHSDHYTNDVRPMGVGLELYGRRKDGREFPTQQGERAQTGLDAPAGARPGPLSRHVLAALHLR